MAEWLQFSGERAIVMGAGGLGTACALELAEAGLQVVVVDRDERRLEEVVSRSGAVLPLRRSLKDREESEMAVDDAADLLGGLDVLVHAIGMNIRVPVLDFAEQDWVEIFQVNLSSAFWSARRGAERMMELGGGRMVLLSSVAGTIAHPRHVPYALFKAALNHMVRGMAVEWAEFGVTVNAVAPTYSETDLTRTYLRDPLIRQGIIDRIPLGRLASAADVSSAVVFLCSPRSGFITGQILHVDGGRTLL